MTDDEKRALVTRKPIFQPFYSGKIQMVRRLVQQQQVRILSQRLGDSRTSAFAAARSGSGRCHVDAELSRNRGNFVLGRRVRSSQREVHQRVETGKVRFLLKHDDPHMRLHLPLPSVGFDAIVDQPEQRRLSRSVPPDKCDAVAWSDMQIKRLSLRPAEKPTSALLQADAFER